MKFSKKHIDAVEERLMEYEKCLASEQFHQLDWCDVCDSVPGHGCSGCLFCHEGTDCRSRVGYGADCRTKQEQREQYNRLLGQIEKNGYKFVEVDND